MCVYMCVVREINSGHYPESDQLIQRNFAHACWKSTVTVLLPEIGLVTTLVLILTYFAM